MNRHGPQAGAWEIVGQIVARTIEGPNQLLNACVAATLHVAEYLVQVWDKDLASDIRQYRESLRRKDEAETTKHEADAQKALAEATRAANKANLAKRRDAIARLEREMREAEVAKTKAKAQVILIDAETRRLKTVAHAKAELLEAISKLRQEGGDFLVDPENLEQMLFGTPPMLEDDREDDKDKPSDIG